MRFQSINHAVRAYRAMGFRVVPLHGVDAHGCMCRNPECKPRDHGKHEPAHTDGAWKDGAEYGPADFSEGDNIGLAMGPWNGSGDWLVALDIDGDLNTDLFGWALPPTMTQRSQRGRHLVFTVPAYSPLGNWVDVLSTKPSHDAAVDLRYARGRIVAAPSRGAFGSYEWVEFRAPVALPDHVVDDILDRRRARGLPVEREWSRSGKRP